MLLPNRKKAHVPKLKLTSYLLSSTHPVGKTKAQFYQLHGYTNENANFLKRELLEAARKGEVQTTVNTAYGTKYIIEDSIRTPKGDTIEVRTIWIIETKEVNPRFVTAYPIQ
jgi:hypothetical protein